MKGLLVWAQSSCRSQMAFYRELGKALRVPLEVAVWFYRTDKSYVDNRTALGFHDEDEFSDMTIHRVGEDYEKGKRLLDEHPGWGHLFCCYQWSPAFRRIQLEAARRGERTAVGSEAPCNMFTGWRKWAKEVYFRTKLPRMVKDIVSVSDFFINYSGADDRLPRLIGWPKEKVLPFGYFPPPLPGTKCVQRTTNRPFEILVTGEMTWHRGSDVALEACSILKHHGIDYHATFTQKGPLLERLRTRAVRENLPIDFVGFLPLQDLYKAYETCSVYIGAGRHEPWGMRLNDALNCGAPLVVSRGMGGVKMIDDYGCGLAFENEDSKGLASQLTRLYENGELYARCAANVMTAVEKCSAEAQARELVLHIQERFPAWLS